ncbi:uncharacterized protein BJ171DRAFT_494319 [Polychytrium aggregatum]|uniref:uncharacterized protein n=1 Tax=Polychytrium aggregatum TaxID=110093 RepID=UPI0022FEA2DE|nr:uncharacterized protein BJ171DRAFT_494319 [Polychytrium aggregatum]KAI9207333.1 hypothetical protein BJ171DRAFT_494319 [Polychytrium aggregatum]
MSPTIYIRIKRHRTTWFLEANPSDSVVAVKTRFAALLLEKTDPRDVRFSIHNSQTNVYTPLEDGSMLDQLGLKNESVLFATFWISNEANAAEGKWEIPEVPEFEPLHDDEPADLKGKAVA